MSLSMRYQYHDEHIIKSLPENHIFVFGSDLAGRHEEGGARIAQQHFGAVKGVSRGWMGQSFAIPTLDRSLAPLSCEEIASYIDDFKIYTQNHLSTMYFITALGCGLAGNPISRIAPLFKGISNNVILPESFQVFLEENIQTIYPPLTQSFIHQFFIQYKGETEKNLLEIDGIYKPLINKILDEDIFPTDRYGRNRTYEIDDITYQVKSKIPELYSPKNKEQWISSLILIFMEIYEFNEKDFIDLWKGKKILKHPIDHS